LSASLVERQFAYDLQPVTPAGRRFVALAEKHAEEAAARAAASDRAAAFPHETFSEMQASGFLAACLPGELGGLDIVKSADIAAAFNRLARGDGATALAAHMHCVTALGLARLWRAAVEASTQLPGWLDDLVEGIGRGEFLVCVAGSEPGQTLGWFETEGVPTEGGYLLSGRKAFASNSPAATHLYVTFRVPQPSGAWLNAVTIVEASTPGVEICSDWDSLGMRGSGSNGIVFDRCFVERDRLVPIGPPLQMSRFWIRFFVEGNVGLLASFLGVAECAADIAITEASERRSAVTGTLMAERPGIQQTVAELKVCLGAATASVERVARLTDEFYERDAVTPQPLEAHHRLMAEFQAAKLHVNRMATQAVDVAMTVSGGASYMNKHPLSRLYRDVRAGSFMQAYSPIEASEYIGKVILGLEPLPTQ
jgi:Acyl-CoA dehydrogenases